MIKDNLEWADTGFSAILLASVVMFFVVQAFKIPSGSMRMTFVEGDHLFVNKFIYGIPIPLTDKKVLPMRKVTPGDIVIFRFPAKNKDNPHYGKDFIKRCIALEGQKVQVIDKKVYVDGARARGTIRAARGGHRLSGAARIRVGDFQNELGIRPVRGSGRQRNSRQLRPGHCSEGPHLCDGRQPRPFVRFAFLGTARREGRSKAKRGFCIGLDTVSYG